MSYAEQYRNSPVDAHKVLSAATLPLSSTMKKGPMHLRLKCHCDRDCIHVSYFDAMKTIENDDGKYPTEFCYNANSFFEGPLPCWATGLRLKKEFVDIPAIRFLRNLFKRSTYWWKFMEDNGKLSREGRLLLYSSTGMSLQDIGYINQDKLLGLKTDRAAMGRLKNFFCTLDGLLQTILFSSQGKSEICNYGFFDRVIKTYMKNAIFDLFKTGLEGTYYASLKKCRGVLKDVLLKERKALESPFASQFWYFNYILKVLGLNRSVPLPKDLVSIAYLIQTRACGLPPMTVSNKAIKDFFDLVTVQASSLSHLAKRDIALAARSLAKDVKSQKNFHNLFNRALLESKISLSTSSSFFYPRGVGGKSRAFNRLFNNKVRGRMVPIYNLNTGKVSHEELATLEEPEKISYWVFHYSIGLAVSNLKYTPGNTPDIGDVRYSVVLENGKARLITVSRAEHSITLNPIAKILSEFISSFESSATGMKASNHLYDLFKRLKRENVPKDGIYKYPDIETQKEFEAETGIKPDFDRGSSTFFGSEDWTTATDSMNPNSVKVELYNFLMSFGLPKFYVQLAINLLIMPRRIFGKEILRTMDFTRVHGIKLKGIFQGDPLCKQSLHLSHLVSRRIAENIMVSFPDKNLILSNEIRERVELLELRMSNTVITTENNVTHRFPNRSDNMSPIIH